MTNHRKPEILFQPETYHTFLRGVNIVVKAIRPTLGPYPRLVVYHGPHGPEFLDDGGLIARRIIQLTDRKADIGAMFLRQMLWNLRQKTGDGTVTAAIMFHTILREGIRYITAGGNAMKLRRHLEAGQQIILEMLEKMSCPIRGQTQLATLAEMVCHDSKLATVLGEVFHIIGPFGKLDIRAGQSLTVDREYTAGVFWDSGVHSSHMLFDPLRRRTDLEHPAILISDLAIHDPRDLLPLLTEAVNANINALVLVVRTISDLPLGLLTNEQTRQKIKVIAVKTPGQSITEQFESLTDMALLTGGRPILAATGASLREVTIADLGRAQRAWATLDYFGFIGGKGDAHRVREHVASLGNAFRQADDLDRRQKLLQRLGVILGGTATLWVGGNTESEINARRTLTERAAQTLRGALLEGVLPGGGAALLRCCPVLQKYLDQSSSPDEQAAYRILLQAIAEPVRTLWHNAGYEGSVMMTRINRAGAGFGFDLQNRRIVDMVQAGIVDSTVAQKEAVRTAISGAALALTVDVLVYHKEPRLSLEP